MTTRSITALVLATLGAANGTLMLGWPGTWYAVTPGVSEHGAFNAHFIRDIGVVFLITAASMAWVVRWRPAWPAAMAGALFLAIHALIHVIEAAGGHVSRGAAIQEVPLMLALAAAALWVAWPPRAA